MSDEAKLVADVKEVGTAVSAAQADLKVEVTKVKSFWAKYGHPVFYALVSIVSAYVGHKL